MGWQVLFFERRIKELIHVEPQRPIHFFICIDDFRRCFTVNERPDFRTLVIFGRRIFKHARRGLPNPLVISLHLGRLLGAQSSKHATVARWSLLSQDGSTDRTDCASYHPDAAELLVGRFSKHDDTCLSSIRPRGSKRRWRWTIPSHSLLAQPHQPVWCLSRSQSLVIAQTASSSIVMLSR